MIELEHEDIFESGDGYESRGASYEGEDGEYGEYSELTRDKYVDRVRFDRIPTEARPQVKGEESTASADPLYIYYRSMSKIPLLTREEEVYLAKKIESAKTNTLRLLALTPISTRKLGEIAEDLQPITQAPAIQIIPGELKKEGDPEVSLEERKRLCGLEIRRILGRLDKLENKYLESKRSLAAARSQARTKTVARIKKCRESVYQTLTRLDLSENQVNEVIAALEEVLDSMESARLQLEKASRGRKDPKAMREARSRVRQLGREYLTTPGELRKITTLIRENKMEMCGPRTNSSVRT